MCSENWAGHEDESAVSKAASKSEEIANNTSVPSFAFLR
jgi:hypothetical protein